MNATGRLLIALMAGLVLSTSQAVGQGTIAGAVELHDPSLSSRVLFEAPAFTIDWTGPCDTHPMRSECDAIGISAALDLGTDSVGNLYGVSSPFSIENNPPVSRSGVALLRTDPSSSTVLIGYLLSDFCGVFGCGESVRYTYGRHITLDATNGRILIPVRADIYSAGGLSNTMVGVAEISGLPKMFDTLLSFVPGGTLAALIPAHPDGFRNADFVQVWTGDVRSMPDWSQAQPLTCEAATNPTPGQVVTLADTLPDPAVGAGRYYITATQHAADRRLGRQYVNGAFSARDPASLPACAP